MDARADFADGYNPYRSSVGATAEQRKKIIMGPAGRSLFALDVVITAIAIGGH